jgi:transcriptional regulator with XRE-family HTH domain
VAPRPSDPDPALGAVLREERERQGRSQEGLAHDAGLTTNALARIELGQSDPSFSTVTRIAKALGISRAELMQRVEHKR